MNIPSSNDARSVSELASRYTDIGWSVIPVRPGTKAPNLKSWKPYTEKAPSETELRKWFKDDDVGIAVCLGAISGHLVCRDFDDEDAFFRWVDAHEDLANSLPISVTNRGFHVYFRVNEGAVELISPTGSSIVDYGDGELRGGGIAVLPPSVHESGHVYCWLPEPPEEVPLVEDLVESGLAQPWPPEAKSYDEAKGFTYEERGAQKTTDDSRGIEKKTEDHKSQDGERATGEDGIVDISFFTPWFDEIEAAIDKTLPSNSGQRNKCIFKFARKLKTIEGMASLDPIDFESVVHVWYDLAEPVIRTKNFEECFCDFCRAWEKIKYLEGETLLQFWEEAMARPFPECCKRFSPEVQKLVALCERLHWTCAQNAFPLACRPVGALLGVSHLTASKWLDILVRKKVLEVVLKGGPTNRKATRYRYLGDLIGDPRVSS